MPEDEVGIEFRDAENPKRDQRDAESGLESGLPPGIESSRNGMQGDRKLGLYWDEKLGCDRDYSHPDSGVKIGMQSGLPSGIESSRNGTQGDQKLGLCWDEKSGGDRDYSRPDSGVKIGMR